MKSSQIIFFCVIITASVAFGVDAPTSLNLVRKIPMPDVNGRIDHMSIDAKGRRLFISALGNDTVEILDLNSGSKINSITGLNGPQGVLFVPDSNKLYVTNGGNGECDIFNVDSRSLTGKIKFSDDADNMRYDATTALIYVGFGEGGIAVIDSKTDKQTGVIKLPQHPEAFEIEADSNRIFVNVPEAGYIAVADRKKMEVETVWQVKSAGDNFPMAIDCNNHRLFVGCRHPAKLLIFDTRLGNLIQDININGDADDIFCDKKNNRVYISCGEGFIDVLQGFDESGNQGYKVLEKIPTAAGARTSLFVPESQSLYLAVPSRPEQPAQIWVYQTP